MNNAIRAVDGSFEVNHAVRFAGAAVGTAERHRLLDLLHLMGAQVNEVVPADALEPITLRRLSAGAALFHEGARADFVYVVRTGSFKTFHTTEDGYEQVLAFAGRADVLGFDAVCLGYHPTAVVALEDSAVYVLPMSKFFTLAQRVAVLDRAVHWAVSRQLCHRSDLMAGVTAAEVRLARFLLLLSRRAAASGQPALRIHLSMSRRDIASYLGLTHETISRSFGALADWDYVAVKRREIEILDVVGLKAFSCVSRRHVEEASRPASHVSSTVRLSP
ncbi:MAG: Crp/Fnr family transcriptional regulator [Pseudomonadota bacterium]